MNYAHGSGRVFVTKKNLSEKKTVSAEVKSRKSFIRSHKFEVHVNPSTGAAEVNITKE
ncbi:MAG TPA: hypothetical protein IAA26_01955 [Candidatus Blautia faecipullorum]|nr:hypothetical protein [Candidatus Blautia faecipullorum]